MQSISAMFEYADKSSEELRWEHYQVGPVQMCAVHNVRNAKDGSKQT